MYRRGKSLTLYAYAYGKARKKIWLDTRVFTFQLSLDHSCFLLFLYFTNHIMYPITSASNSLLRVFALLCDPYLHS